MKRMMMGCLNGVKQVSLTNLVTNGNFASTTGWISSGASFTVSGNEASFLANSTSDTLAQNKSITSGRVYYYAIWCKASSSSVAVGVSNMVSGGTVSHSGGSSYEFLSIRAVAASTVSAVVWAIADNRSSSWNTVNCKYATMIDLTAAFGAGNEPTKAQMDNLMLQFPERWLNGTQNAVYTW